MGKRDDFTAATKRILSARAAYFCSSPECRKLTIGPHSSADKALQTGHAAHIHAAARGGARYDPKQTPEERRSLSNGIWMCRECGDIVDKDEDGYPAEKLRIWKAAHEAMVHETRTKGYAKSLALLLGGSASRQNAKRVIAILEDRRVLWVSFDRERPHAVKQSLDMIRSELRRLRGDLIADDPFDAVLLTLVRSIHAFFDRMDALRIDLDHLRWGDPHFEEFSAALGGLRKAVGIQLLRLADKFGLEVADELRPALFPAVSSS